MMNVIISNPCTWEGIVAEQASLSLTWSETPEDTFSHDGARILFNPYIIKSVWGIKNVLSLLNIVKSFGK